MDGDSLGVMKADILSWKRAELDSRREAACYELRKCRDWDYERLLKGQQTERAALTERQAKGLRSSRPRSQERQRTFHTTTRGRRPGTADFADPVPSAKAEPFSWF